MSQIDKPASSDPVPERWTEEFEEACIRAVFQCFPQNMADRLAPAVWKDGIDINCLSPATKLFICKVTAGAKAQIRELARALQEITAINMPKTFGGRDDFHSGVSCFFRAYNIADAALSKVPKELLP